MKKISKVNLFLELAQPDKTGNSRKVLVSEFVGKYERLKFGNGGDWCRSDGTLAKKYIIERFKEGNSIVAIQLFGFNNKKRIQKQIRQDIAKVIIEAHIAKVIIEALVLVAIDTILKNSIRKYQKEISKIKDDKGE